ncbi:MAG: GtrA family protein [Paracoccaceae bacterium]|nr:GtrA family protein [Paracoccaceae bacterium]MDE3237641.1 GtrA family protein [Paracoccaceae bacterium]
MSLTGLILRYGLFAAIATVVNLLVQRGALALWPELLPAMIAGTGAGLVVKYVLDKRWIFFDGAVGLAQHGRKFLLYSAMGVVTTVIFWGFETGAWALWGTEAAREAGAVIGLAIGYVVKFRLDRRFVFTDAQLSLRGAA